MDIKELKQKINDGSISGEFMIWILEDDSSQIIVDQYIEKICSIRKLVPKFIDNYNEIPDTSFVIDDNLYLLRTDKLTEIKEYNNLIVLCNKCNDKRSIKIPKLEDWQVVDYLSCKVPGVDKREIEWLATQYNRNYGRMINDLDKISIFPQQSQAGIYKLLLNDHQFKDVTSLNIWDLTNGIIRKDLNLVKDVLSYIKYIDIEPIGLLTTLYKGFKNVINVQLNPNCNADELGLNGKQFFVIKKYNCNHYNKKQLISIFELLTSLEYRYKYDSIDMNQLIDYMVVKILGE